MKKFSDDDILKRENFARKLMKIFDNSDLYSSDNNFVVALNAPWGAGKTTFIEKYQSLVESEFNSSYEIFTYNSWEDDGFSTPLIPIINALISSFPDENVNEETKKELIKVASKLGKLLAKGLGKKLLVDKMNVDLDELKTIISDDLLVDVKDISKAINKSEDTEIQIQYKEYEVVREHFKQLINKVSLKKKLIFVIDELDRCRPNYAIEVLEAIKHYFDINNVVFLISLDIEQLSHSIATVYGQNMDSRGYLLRFFNLNIRLPQPSIDDYVQMVCERYEIKVEEYQNYKFSEIFMKLGCSLRDVERIILNFKILLDTSFFQVSYKKKQEIYLFFLILKYKYPLIFEMILFEKFLEHGNSTNREFKVLPDKFYLLTDNIKQALDELKNGENSNSPSDTSIFVFSEDSNLISNSVSLGKYIEGKLEMFESSDF